MQNSNYRPLQVAVIRYGVSDKARETIHDGEFDKFRETFVKICNYELNPKGADLDLNSVEGKRVTELAKMGFLKDDETMRRALDLFYICKSKPV